VAVQAGPCPVVAHGGARRERDGDDLAALARDDQVAVPALQAEVLDVGAGRLRYAQLDQGAGTRSLPTLSSPIIASAEELPGTERFCPAVTLWPDVPVFVGT
jgi:hypothetical protein